MTRFVEHTSVTRVADGRYEGEVRPDWHIVRGANGGHLAAMLLRGMAQAVGEETRHPRSLTVHFGRVPKEAPVYIETEILRTGRTMSNVAARMVQDDKVIANGIALFATQTEGKRDFQDIQMPEVPRPDDIEQVNDRDDFPFGRQFDFRQTGDFAGQAENAIWMRLREPQATDAFGAVQLCDAFAPAVFGKLATGGGGAGVPTLEMTYHLRETLPIASDKPGAWYLGVFKTSVLRQGFLEEDGWLWSEDGTLVAQSRQLALLA